MDVLARDYAIALNKLASQLGLKYEELAEFCGDIEDGDFGARRLKEFFKSPEVSEMLDQIAHISEQYRNETLALRAC